MWESIKVDQDEMTIALVPESKRVILVFADLARVALDRLKRLND